MQPLAREVLLISLILTAYRQSETFKTDVYVPYDSLDHPEWELHSPDLNRSATDYVITEDRLKQLRSKFMYWYFDKGGEDGVGDFQRQVQHSTPQIQKDFDFEIPFFGIRYNYTKLSLHGFLGFSDPPEIYTFPLVFPVKDWPKINDPAFIAIFYSKSRIGIVEPTDLDRRRAGVYFRVEENLNNRTDQFGVELRERLTHDIHEGIHGSNNFHPTHAIIATWKNVSFEGGIDESLTRTNTFQIVLATDQISTYVLFNYLNIRWTSQVEAGGDTLNGEGGVPAYVGFNRGNGTQSYEYTPYSQNTVIRDLQIRGGINGFPGRYIFRIDENIVSGNSIEISQNDS